MYRLRKNYYKDYFWQAEGGHAPVTRYLTPYDTKYWWWDLFNPAGPPWRWYIGVLEISDKWYAQWHHIYSTVNSGITGPPQALKMGLFIDCGITYLPSTNPIQVVECAHEVPPSAIGGAIRPGFEGQYGADDSVPYTGNIYEFAWSKFPLGPPSPGGVCGISIYGDGGVGGSTDALHIAFLANTDNIYVIDSAGVWQFITGPCALIMRGPFNTAMAPANMVLVGTIPIVYTPIDPIASPDEYFVRLEFWPEKKVDKNWEAEYDQMPNVDRVLKLYFGTDKTNLYYEGSVQVAEKLFDNARRYIYLFAMDEYYDPIEEGWLPYWDYRVQFDEVVVGSEWLPWDDIYCRLGHTAMTSHIVIKYAKEEDELRMVPAGPGSGVIPAFRMKEQVELFSVVERLQSQFSRLYGSDFQTPFPDGWTLTATVIGSAWAQRATQDSGRPQFRDEFDIVFANKNLDPNWTVDGANAFDTTTVSGYLYTLGAAAGGVYTNIPITTTDFTTEFTVYLTPVGGNQYVYHYWGMNGAAWQNGAIALHFDEPNNRWYLREYFGGAPVNRGNALGYSPVGTTRTVKVVRLGALCKVYVDNDLIIMAPLGLTACTLDNFRVYSSAVNNGVQWGYVRHYRVFPDGYCYMTNPSLTTNVGGDISRTFASGAGTVPYSQIDFIVKFWEAFEENGIAGQSADVYMYYDNPIIPNNYARLQLLYDGANYQLIAYHDSATQVLCTLPSDVPRIGVYNERTFRLRVVTPGGLQTQVTQVINDDDGKLLGTVTGAWYNIAASPTVTLAMTVPAGGETPYFGDILMLRANQTTPVLIETPIFHGEIKRVPWRDEEGSLVIEGFGFTYRLMEIPENDVYSGTFHPAETAVTPFEVLSEYLLEDGHPYFRWLHWYNFRPGGLGWLWSFIRVRGLTAFDLFRIWTEFTGRRWQTTPEMQFIVDEFFRDFTIRDYLGTGDALPQGLFFSGADATLFEETQKNLVNSLSRVDDATVGKWLEAIQSHPSQRLNPFVGTDQVWSGGAHVAPTPVTWATSQTTGNLTGSGRTGGIWDRVFSTLGADGSDPTVMQFYYEYEKIKTESHRNETLEWVLIGTKPWYRPMDVIWARTDLYDPDLNSVVVSSMHPVYKYVVYSVEHFCGQGYVKYVIGRIEQEWEGEEYQTIVNGYGICNSQEQIERSRSERIIDSKSQVQK